MLDVKKTLAKILQRLENGILNTVYDIGTNNTTDTWVFVLNGNKIQHRVLPLNQVDKTMIARGAFSAGDIDANSYKDITVSFGKTFSSVPTVVCCLSSTSTAGAIGSMTATPHSETTTECKIRVFNAGSATRTPGIRWIATNA